MELSEFSLAIICTLTQELTWGRFRDNNRWCVGKSRKLPNLMLIETRSQSNKRLIHREINCQEASRKKKQSNLFQSIRLRWCGSIRFCFSLNYAAKSHWSELIFKESFACGNIPRNFLQVEVQLKIYSFFSEENRVHRLLQLPLQQLCFHVIHLELTCRETLSLAKHAWHNTHMKHRVA